MSFGQIVGYRGFEGTKSRPDSPATLSVPFTSRNFKVDASGPSFAILGLLDEGVIFEATGRALLPSAATRCLPADILRLNDFISFRGNIKVSLMFKLWQLEWSRPPFSKFR